MIISIVGPSDSGKTTLITKIVPLLIEKGLKVAVVKHHAHGDFEVDKEGKDSWKIYKSGADVIISSSKKMAFIKRMKEDSLDYVYERYLKNDYDLVLTEGYSRAKKDRIVVVKNPEEIEYFKHGRILAVVCDEEFASKNYRIFKRDQVGEIAEFIYELTKNRNYES